MPGYLGGSSSGSGTGGEISFPKEFIDPVTKLRISQPENLIDTDFEYGLQPTKWETVELINNTPSFFSKSGDTTIPNITSITTNAGTRQITVVTDFDHALSVGIPISVTGTKSITADGAYIINSIPNPTTFTYLCKANQPNTSAIQDLYSSIITGEFFQGSQLRIADSSGIVTDDATTSVLTVTTESSHGFKVNTPFYFLNLNSTISQDFPASNTVAKSFDSTNSATAQTFDGSNTLSSINIDWSNSGVAGGVVSTISGVSVVNNTITVAHSTENFSGRPLGTPLYYAVTGGAGYFLSNPRGVVFLKTTTSLGTSTSTFQVSAVPDGDPIAITASISGTFQLSNQSRTFSGNNVNPLTQTNIDILKGNPQILDASNTAGTTGTNASYSGSNVTVTSLVDLNWYANAMVFYTTTGAAASGLTANTTYFIDTYFRQGVSNNYSFTLKPLPNAAVITSISGGTGIQSFQQIGISLDKDIFHVKDNGFEALDMLEYTYPEGGRFGVNAADEIKDFYFIQTRYDQHNFTLNQNTGELSPKNITITVDRGTPITPTTVTPTGLTAPITYAVSSGVLPNGLALNVNTGSVSGTPVEVVTGRQVIITATDATGLTAFQNHTYTINATIGSINPATISRENIFATQAITPTTATTVNLVAPITWAISSGTLPTGLNFNTTNGVISGTPTEIIAAPGRQVTVRATDVGGLQGFQVVTFQINPAPRLYSFTSAQFNSGGATNRNGPDINQARAGVGNPSWAATYLNMTQQGMQLWTVPEDGTYRIQTYGSVGGWSNNWGQRGGYGAGNRGDFTLTKDTVLKIAIGHQGASDTYDGGGGGGTGVVFAANNQPLIISGGGGGGCPDGNEHRDSYGNQTSGRGGAWGQGGVSGNGGSSSSTPGGGGGLFNNGGGSWPGQSFINGGVGGPGYFGGFGAGGGGAGGGTNGAGGGGGYSGGGAWPWSGCGAGGGSINNGTNQVNSNSANGGVGFLTITRL
jgi:hypothetical protein